MRGRRGVTSHTNPSGVVVYTRLAAGAQGAVSSPVAAAAVDARWEASTIASHIVQVRSPIFGRQVRGPHATVHARRNGPFARRTKAPPSPTELAAHEAQIALVASTSARPSDAAGLGAWRAPRCTEAQRGRARPARGMRVQRIDSPRAAASRELALVAAQIAEVEKAVAAQERAKQASRSGSSTPRGSARAAQSLSCALSERERLRRAAPLHAPALRATPTAAAAAVQRCRQWWRINRCLSLSGRVPSAAKVGARARAARARRR